MVQCIEIERYRVRTALVQHFADGKSNGAASHITEMVWRYRSPIQWGGGGGGAFCILMVITIAFMVARGGGRPHPVVYSHI